MVAKLLSIVLSDFPTDKILTNEQWIETISTIGGQYNINAEEAARLLSININERMNKKQKYH